MNFMKSGAWIYLASMSVFASEVIAQAPADFKIEKVSVGNYELSWTGENMKPYQVEESDDLETWGNLGNHIIGVGNLLSVTDVNLDPKNFYRIRVGTVRPGFDEFEIDRNDDGSSPQVPIGFDISLFGKNESMCWVNNNGNITFDSRLSTYTPNPLQDLGRAIIAPFWADVDTRAEESDIVSYSYGTETVNGHLAFGVNWVNVGYYNRKSDKLNSFQLILIEREDIAAGDFDIEFNYNRILWETGDASSGVNGYGGFPSRSGLTNGIDRTIELAHSGETLVQLDFDPNTELPNLLTGLIYRSRNSPLPGRFTFQVRSGAVIGALAVNAGADQNWTALQTSAVLAGTASDPSGGAITLKWTVLDGPANVTFSDATILNPTVTIPTGETTVLQLTASSVADPNVGAADIMVINP